MQVSADLFILGDSAFNSGIENRFSATFTVRQAL